MLAGHESTLLSSDFLAGTAPRRSNFGKLSGWSHALRSVGAEGLHFHDLRHAGNTFAAAGDAGIKDLMARMGHDSQRAATIHQHLGRVTRTRSLPVTLTLMSRPSAATGQKVMAPLASWCRSANGPLMAWNEVDRR